MAFKFSQSDLNAINAAKAIRDYNDAEASLAARSLANQQAQSKQKQGGLLGVLQGIGDSIGNVGKAFGATFGSVATNSPLTALGDAIINKKSYTQAVRDANKRQDDLVKDIYGTDSVKDAYTKNLGSSLDASATLLDFVPGLGKGAKIALNVGQGVASGVGNQLATNGENTTLEQALQGGLIGGASSGVGQAVGGGLANKAMTSPARGAIGKAVQSGIGRSAITGAASGAIGGGLATAFQGGDLGQTLQGALEGAGQGALGGATTGAVYGVIGKGVNKVNDRILNGKKSTTQTPTNVLADTQEDLPEATKKRQQATNWEGEQVNASKRNTIEKIGKVLEETGKNTENQNVLGRLETSTADRVKRNGTIEKLKKEYGYTPTDYDRAAELSTAANHFVQQEAEMSGASGFDTDLVNKVSLRSENVPEMSQKTQSAYRKKSQQLLQSALVDGGSPDEYSVSGLYKAAEAAGDLADSYYRKSHDKSNQVTSAEFDSLSKAYSNLKNEMRATADNMLGGDIDQITRNNLVAMLKNAGAPEQAIQTLSQAKNFRDLIRRTSPLEEARTIDLQVGKSKLSKGATTDSIVTRPGTEFLKSTGAPQLATALATPVGQFAGKVEQGIGKGISAFGGAVDGKSNSVPGKTIGKVAGVVRAANEGLDGPMGSLATRQIAREAGYMPVNNARITKEQTDALNAYNEAAAANDAALANYQNVMAQIQAAEAQNSEGAQKLQQISDAMDQALAMGDITSYNKLADLYSTAYKIYGKQLEAAQAAANPLSNLTSAQIENINKLDTASNAIDELESLFQKAGGGQGLIGGNAASFMASLGLNSDVSTYNSMARGLINEISAATGKTDALNNEGEVQRALDLIPKVTDDAQTATNKLEQLRRMLATNKQTVYRNYGLTS